MSAATGSRGAIISGWGTALPPKVVTNDDLAAMVDTNDEWIRDRSGIRERRIGGTTAGLAIEAGAAAMARAGAAADQIDLVILATTTPDDQVPATAPAVQHGLGLSCGAMDLNAACSGFMYGLVTAHAMIGMGCERILVVGAETLSRIVDWTDRTTCILFADGAGAVVVEACDGEGELLGWDLASQGELRHLLFADVGGTLEMEGKEVFRQAVKAMATSAEASFAQAGVSADDIDIVIPHQANVRIIDAAMNRLGIPTEKASMVLQYTGNTSSATIPLALAKALDGDRIAPGDLVLLVGFGAGMTSASAVLRWGGV